MCGIIGIIDRNSPKAAIAALTASLPRLLSRGPDGEGTWHEGPVAMGMRRLSVLDVDGGTQPFYDNERNVVAFQNGEIYNFRELKAELEGHGCRFRSNCDTEVLAHGYTIWGLRGLARRLDGMFAVALFDRKRNALHLFRDRFGEKPLFFAHGHSTFAYSSNLLTLAELPWVETRPDQQALHRYLMLGYIPGPSTFFSGVRRIPPGGGLSLSLDDFTSTPFLYSLPYFSEPRRTDRSLKENCEELRSLLDQAVSSRLLADVPLGVFLSGGIDSSLIAALAARKQPRIDTFSIGFSSSHHDERNFARMVARHIGSTHHEFLFDENSFLDLLPEVVRALDEPLGDQACLPLFRLSREARQLVTVVLSGEGADEIFGGYSYYQPFLGNGAGAGRDYLSDSAAPISPSGFPLLMSGADAATLLADPATGPTAWENSLTDLYGTTRTPLQRARLADMTSWLPDDLLVKLDRMTMGCSLEGRVPFLAPEVVHFGLNLPDSQCIDNNTEKVVLRQLAREYLPQEIFTRPKQGFVLPMESWLDTWFKTSGSPEHYFRERQIDGLDTARVAAFCKREIKTGMRNQRAVFALIMLYEWKFYNLSTTG